jgi:superfamily II DNA or RNA helicase
MADEISSGSMVQGKTKELSQYGVGTVLKCGGGMAKVEFKPSLFTKPPYMSRTTNFSVEDLQALDDPLALLASGLFDPAWQFDLKQEAARMLVANKGGQLSNARTQILPHQIFTAHRVVSSAVRRFLLADEVGLGKTIEAGMIWQSLHQRGAATRTLIICPAGLTPQWKDEMWDKFGAEFEIYRIEFDTALSPRLWDTKTAVISSLETLRLPEHKRLLLENRRWDLIIFDEAHRLSAVDYGGAKVDKTKSFQLAEELRYYTDALLLLTATPHQGDRAHSRFIHLMELLNEDIDFSALSKDEFLFPTGRIPFSQLILRTPKMVVTDAEGKKVFHGRQPHSFSFDMNPDEARFYRAVSSYIVKGYKALEAALDGHRKRAIGFVLTTFMKLAASSSHAIRNALEKRHQRLKKRLEDYKAAYPQKEQEPELDERFLGEFEETKALMNDDEIMQGEISELERLLKMRVRVDKKMEELLKFVGEMFYQIENPKERKILIFTEYLKTQDRICEALRKEYGEDSVVIIRGGMTDQIIGGDGVRRQARKESERLFRDHDTVHFLVSTEAGGEGINLQHCHIVFNYDLPWNPMRIEQRVGRVYRFGQKKVVQTYNFSNKNTVEDKIWGYMQDRLDRAAAALAEVTGEDVEDIKASLVGQMETQIDYNKVYIRAHVDKAVTQSNAEIREGIQKAKRALEIARNDLFKDVSSYSFDQYREHLHTGLSLSNLEDLTVRYLSQRHRQVRRENGVLRFLTPEELLEASAVPSRVEQATFSRDLAMDNPNLQLLGIGNPFVDAMLRRCGSYDFGGNAACRVVRSRQAKETSRGVQFNFMYRTQIMRKEGEEDCLFEVYPVFIDQHLHYDPRLSQICFESYSDEQASDDQSRFAFAKTMDLQAAYDLAAQVIQKKFTDFFDWEENVSLLNCAFVIVSS